MTKVCLMADLHGFLPDFDKDTDILILAGDVEPPEGLTMAWAKRHIQWRRYDEISVMVIPGNHDTYKGQLEAFDAVDTDSGLHIWASPITVGESKGRPHVMDDTLAFAFYQKMPMNVDIAVVHSPPYGALDEHEGIHIGSRALLDVVRLHQPKHLVCGHAHNNYGEGRIGNTVVHNVALCGFPEKKIINPPKYLYL